MEKQRSKHFNFALVLAIFFVFFALVWFGIDNAGGFKKQQQDLESGRTEDVILTEKFGFMEGKPEVVNDPVLGMQTIWTQEKATLTINDKHLIYRNKAAIAGKIQDTKPLQERAQAFIDEKSLNNNVVINYERNKLLVANNVHYEIAEYSKDTDILEVIFVDAVSGEDSIRVWVTGAGDIQEVLIVKN